uniref:Lipase_3 domain-containing protein n=1 Tax=Panagrellus redivivus TaxID=6233 RepID=A0A7E4W0Y4_PANRE
MYSFTTINTDNMYARTFSLFVCSLLLNFVTCQTPSLPSLAFDPAFARNYLYPISSAAFSLYPQACLNDVFGRNNSKVISYTQKACDDLNKETCAGYLAISDTRKAIILAFRGSNDNFQVIEEAGSIFKQMEDSIIGGKVNSYFYKAFQTLWTDGLRDSFLTAKNACPSYEIWVTGHSLGAAMASLAAGDIVKLGYSNNAVVKLVTFGQPRTGDSDYAAAHDLLLPDSYRVVHAHDIVPHLPPEGIEGYRHHRNEIWYNNAMLVSNDTYIECDTDESNACSNSGLDLSIDDHRLYYGVDVMSWALDGCQYP